MNNPYISLNISEEKIRGGKITTGTPVAPRLFALSSQQNCKPALLLLLQNEMNVGLIMSKRWTVDRPTVTSVRCSSMDPNLGDNI